MLHAQVTRERVDDVLDPDHVLHGTERECEPHHRDLHVIQHGHELHQYIQEQWNVRLKQMLD